MSCCRMAIRGKLRPAFNARTQGIFDTGSRTARRQAARALGELHARLGTGACVFTGGVDLTLSGRNLWVWTDYSGYDPGSTCSERTPVLGLGADDGGGPWLRFRRLHPFQSLVSQWRVSTF